MLKQFGIKFIRRQQLEVYPKRYFCSSNRPPKFEGGERNFFQQDKSTPPNTAPLRLLKFGTGIYLTIMVTILCTPFYTAYLMENDPNFFDETVFPYRIARVKRLELARVQRLELTEKETEWLRERSKTSYDPYITVLRFLGITSAKDDGWKKNDINSVDFGDDYTGDGNNQSNDKYDFGNNVFDDNRAGFSSNSDVKDEKAW